MRYLIPAFQNFVFMLISFQNISKLRLSVFRCGFGVGMPMVKSAWNPVGIRSKPLFFLCVVSFTWNWMKLAVLLSAFSAQKWNWLRFHALKGLKLWNRPESVGKKMKLTAAAEGNFRALVQFSKNSPLPRAVSFIFFPTDSGGFITLWPLKPRNHQPLSFCLPK